MFLSRTEAGNSVRDTTIDTELTDELWDTFTDLMLELHANGIRPPVPMRARCIRHAGVMIPSGATDSSNQRDQRLRTSECVLSHAFGSRREPARRITGGFHEENRYRSERLDLAIGMMR